MDFYYIVLAFRPFLANLFLNDLICFLKYVELSGNDYITPPPSFPVFICFSSISKYRPIIQGQQPAGDNLPCAQSFLRQIYCAYAKRASWIRAHTLETHAILNTLVTNGFYRFLVNKTDFFVIFMPILPKYMFPITI